MTRVATLRARPESDATAPEVPYLGGTQVVRPHTPDLLAPVSPAR